MKYVRFFSSTMSSPRLMRYAVIIFINFIYSEGVKSQIIYAAIENSNNGQVFIYKINLNTCEFCAITPTSTNIGQTDIVVLPSGNILNISSFVTNGIKITLPPPSTQVVWQTNNPQFYFTGQLAPNGLVFLAGNTGLGTYNPATNIIIHLGNWPSTFQEVTELYYIDGVLYGTAYDANGNALLVQINTNDPAQSVVIGPLFVTFGAEGGTLNGNNGFFYSGTGIETSDIFFYNDQSGSSELICDLPNDLNIYALSFPPPGLPEYDCIVTCTTGAGSIPQAGPYNICTNGTLNFPAATGTTLDANDLLRYILFSNPADTAGSIVATSSTPSFSFAPPLQTGVIYYIAAMAGNNLNGNVDLNDPCLDFSNALQVVWRPLPTVTFSVANPNVCAGACTILTATFTGTAPFTLTYTSPATGSVTQTFSGGTGTFQVCTLPGVPSESWVVQATALTDAWCACQ